MDQAKTYEAARQAMIDSQIHPMGVVSEAILDAFSTTPRELYVPEGMRGICYCDEDIEIARDRYLMEPSVFARLVQAANPKQDEVVLTIGSGVGYGAAILAKLSSTVIAVEHSAAFLEGAQDAWDETTNCNIVGLEGQLEKGMPKHAPYDLIFINGAVCEVPQSLKDQLGVGGRLIALIRRREDKLAKATLITRSAEDIWGEKVLFEAGTPYLVGFEPKQEFTF